MNTTLKMLLAVVIAGTANIAAIADKVQSSFWGCEFGAAPTNMEEALKERKINYTIDDDGIYIDSVVIAGTTFNTVAMLLSEADGTFYKIVGSNKFTSRDSAYAAYDQAYANIRELYPKHQKVSGPEGTIRMATYLDADNMFYIALFERKVKGKKTYYVNINFWNKLAQQKINELRSN